MGHQPKDPNLRQRRNRTSTKATLSSEETTASNPVPPLPEKEGDWHPMVAAWWASVWRSPMASEYLDADVRSGLFVLALLYEDFYRATSVSARIAASAEIRRAGLPFGLTPMARRTLQWQIEQGETAAAKTAARKAPKADPGKDPRSQLKAVP